jgi:hypothetical protein
MRNISLAIAAIGCFTACGPNGVHADPESAAGIVVYGAGQPSAVEKVTLFAFDDVSIPFRQNLYLQMHSGQKHPGNPVLKRGAPGTPDDYRAQYLGSVVRDDGKFKMWYVAADAEAIKALGRGGSSVKGWRIAYAESADGIHWTKPNLGLVDYHGNRNNNLVSVSPPEVMGWHIIVIHEPDDPDASKRFKAMLMTRWANSSTSIPLYSGDGLHWRMAVPAKLNDYVVPAEGMVLPKEFFEQGGLFRWQGMYYVTGQQIYPAAWLPDGKPCGRVMSIFRSPDFVHWSGTKSLAYVRYGYRSTMVQEGEEMHEPASIWQRGNVLLGAFGLFHGAPKAKKHPMDLGFLVSNDGIHFREPQPDFAFIPRGGKGTWESDAILQGNGFENVGDQTYFWYGGWDNDVTLPDVHAEIGLITLRRDGFGSLSPMKFPAMEGKFSKFKNRSATMGDPPAFVSCPIRVNGMARILLNVEGLSPDARLRVELLDNIETPLVGYSGESAIPLQAPGLDLKISWKNHDWISDLPSPFKIKVTFEGEQRQAIRFYALYLQR